MKYLNIEIARLRSPEYMGSNPTKRATWVNVAAFCAEQENGGLLRGAVAWPDRQWQQLCGVTRREVMAADKLLIVDGQDVIVWGYPKNAEAEIQAKRKAGRQRANSRWNSSADSSANSSADAKGKGKGNRKEIEAHYREHCVRDERATLPSGCADEKKSVKCSQQGIALADKLLPILAIKYGAAYTETEKRRWAAAFDTLAFKGVQVKDMLDFVGWYGDAHEGRYMPALSTHFDLVDKWPRFIEANKKWTEGNWE